MKTYVYKSFIMLLTVILVINSLHLSEINAEEYEENIYTEDHFMNEMNETLKEENMTVSDLDISADKLTVTSEIETADNDSIQSVIDIEPGENTFDLTVIEVDEDENETKYLVAIDDIDNENMRASFTNIETGETLYYDSDEGVASIAFVIPIGIVMTKATLTALFHTGAMVIVSGSAYVVATQAKKSKKYSHFAAIRRDGDLYIGKWLSKSAAVKRLNKSKDTWSVSKHQAKVIASSANPSGAPINEVDQLNNKPRKGRYYHWHPYNRTPKTHAFYGSPVK